jgi:hypothetical protein
MHLIRKLRAGSNRSARRKPLSYANVVATLALFVALAGGTAYANGWIITKTSQIKPSVVKSLTGKTGKTGKTGPAGAAGAAGAAAASGLRRTRNLRASSQNARFGSGAGPGPGLGFGLGLGLGSRSPGSGGSGSWASVIRDPA